MRKEVENQHDVFGVFDPFVFGTTFWPTLMTNWWYNVGRDFVMDPVKMSKYWYDVYVESLNEFFPMFNIINSSGKSIQKNVQDNRI
jgi:hypothetical protein